MNLKIQKFLDFNKIGIFIINFFCLDTEKVTKRNQKNAKAIAKNCDHQIKAKMSPRLQHFLTLLFVFAVPISTFENFINT